MIEPQTWNRYSYVLNNPIRFTDPTGLFTWSSNLGGSATDDELTAAAGAIGDKKERKKAQKRARSIIEQRGKIRTAIELAKAALANPKSGLSASQKQDLSRALDSYGEENKTNLNVVVGQWKSKNAATFFGEGGNIHVMLGSLKDNDLAAQFAHEGSHVADFEAFNAGGSGSDITLYESETRGWLVGSYAAQALNMGSYPSRGDTKAYKRGWTEAQVRSGVGQVLAGGGYGLSVASPGDRLSAVKVKSIQALRDRPSLVY